MYTTVLDHLKRATPRIANLVSQSDVNDVVETIHK